MEITHIATLDAIKHDAIDILYIIKTQIFKKINYFASMSAKYHAADSKNLMIAKYANYRGANNFNEIADRGALENDLDIVEFAEIWELIIFLT